MPSSHSEKPDGGWGWIVVVAAFTANFISDGIQDSFGVLLPSLVDEFNETRSKTAWIGSVLYGAPLIFGPVASFVTDRIGYRKSTILGGLITFAGFTLAPFMNSVDALIITYGLIAGIGLSLPYLSSVVMVASYFERRRGFATAIAESGAGVGTFAVAILTKYLIDVYGWRGAVLLVSSISLNIVACGAAYRPIQWTLTTSDEVGFDNECFGTDASQPDTKHSTIEFKLGDMENDELQGTQNKANSITDTLQPDTKLPPIDLKFELNDPQNNEGENNKAISKKCFSDISIFQNRSFLFFTASVVLFAFWTVVPLVFIVDRAGQINIDNDKRGFLVPSIGITNIVGNILYGILGDRLGHVKRRYLFGASFVLAGIILILVPLFTKFFPTIALCSLYGLFAASEPVLTAIVIIDILGIEKLNNAFGLLMFLEGIAISIGPPVAGWIYDISGTYDNTFYSAGICIVISGVLLILPGLWKSWIYDLSGNYDNTFYSAGMCIVISGVLLILPGLWKSKLCRNLYKIRST